MAEAADPPEEVASKSVPRNLPPQMADAAALTTTMETSGLPADAGAGPKR